MKIVEVLDPMQRGDVHKSAFWKRAWSDVQEAIIKVDWPHGTGKFVLRPRLAEGSKVKHINGVKPIKVPCMKRLVELGWLTEKLPKKLAGVSMGNLDAMLSTEGSPPIGFEWETGNISSSHRAVNKIVHAILDGGLLGGFLVVPSQAMRAYLTDRIGNVTELRGYFPIWKRLNFEKGTLRIVAVEFDELSMDVPIIPKGKDGMAPK